jgi:hypothetical protein
MTFGCHFNHPKGEVEMTSKCHLGCHLSRGIAPVCKQCLYDAIEVRVSMPSVELEQARIRLVRHPNKEGLWIGTERDSRYFSEKIDLLAIGVVLLGVKNVHKICRLCHHHETPVRCESYRLYHANATFQNCQRGPQIAIIPKPAGHIFISGGEDTPIGVPGWCKRVVQMASQGCYDLLSSTVTRR